MKTKAPSSMTKLSFSSILRRFHLTIFFVLMTAAVAGAVLLINTIISDTDSSDGYVSPISAGSIDQATLERVQSLHTSTENTPQLQLPAGRVNPFSE